MKKAFFIAAALCTCILHLNASENIDESSDVFLLMDFNEKIQNNLGGHYNKYESPPSSASTLLSKEVFRGQGGHSLRIHSKQKLGGFNGVWMHFFNLYDENPTYFNTGDYGYFSFWIKGKNGGEDLSIKFADKEWIAKEDSVFIGGIKKFLPNGVTQEWQEVLIPLDWVRYKIDLTELGAVVLDFAKSDKEYTVYVDDFSFKKNRQVPTPLSSTIESSNSAARPAPPGALWVWHTKPLLLDPEKGEALFKLCKEQNIEHIWLQVLLDFEPDPIVYGPPKEDGPSPEFRAEVQYAEELRAFLRKAHQHGLKVHALDGYPEYAQKEYHHVPLAIVDAIIDFNQKSDIEERYDGVHFDNEPYLIIGWHDLERRERILKEFLDLNVECQRRINEHSDMVFGVDIPFWWNKKDPKTGEPMGVVSHNDERKAADFFCIDLLDNVGIMNYRDTAGGADGMIAHGKPFLEYADKRPKAEIYMGVETFSYQPTEVWFPLGIPRKDFEAALEGQAKDFAYLSRIHRFRTQIFDDGMNVHIGIELPPEPTAEDEERMLQAMLEINQRFGISAYPELKSKADDIWMDAGFAMSKDVEWRNPMVRNIKDPETGEEYRGFVGIRIMLPKITFANESYEEFVKQKQAAEHAFVNHPSYAGIAVHFYKTLREKIEETENEN